MTDDNSIGANVMPPLQKVVQQLRDRAMTRQLQANLVLFAIAFIIVSGGVFLVYANTISERGLTGSTLKLGELGEEVSPRLAKIESDLVELNTSIEAYLTSTETLQAKINTLKEPYQSLSMEVLTVFEEAVRRFSEENLAIATDLDSFDRELLNWRNTVNTTYSNLTKNVVGENLRFLQNLEECTELRGDGGGFYYKNITMCIDLLASIEELRTTLLFESKLGDNELPSPPKLEIKRTVLGSDIVERVDRTVADAVSRFSETETQISAEIQVIAEQLLGTHPDLDRLEALSGSLESNRNDFKDAVLSFQETQAAIAAQDWFSFTKATVLRLGVIVLMIFLVQILVNLFRYSTRLAAFYNARADALELMILTGVQTSINELDMVMKSFSPDNLDFGKSAKSPIDQAVEISRNLATYSDRSK